MDNSFINFFNCLTNDAKSYQDKLDEFWCKDIEKYYNILYQAKSSGYMVKRNKQGLHKVIRQ